MRATLFKIITNINSTVAKALIKSGGLDFLNKTRTSMLFEYSLIGALTKESAFIVENLDCCKNVYECLYKLLHEHKLIEEEKDHQWFDGLARETRIL